MDRIDIQLLELLQREGRLSVAELAERVALSQSPCARRLKRLEEDGFIAGYRAVLDRKAVQLATTVFVNVRLMHHREDAVLQFEAAMQAMAEVVACHVVSGAHDYLLEVVVNELSSYEHIVRRLQVLPMVQDITSNFAIRCVKSGAPLPLKMGG
ncbi:Lrp/AsnC family leucine-responsive transcriptional regulator [Paucibacter oligotrophus]|uniref:Lrp/AsnC family leucine-responsive transcriptional regulator n=1 Tax=Roseateles oligotrophus TaxID=1769250 RepID=A0A840LEW0_9BURK|nr:Lrp/AsnC family transcriptional regulator [Roseateles oligotrophus]MBB4844589.1 Lrp/AsnC family leucine-responsive transcriptional regulator [Roseateles oligotrophus]